MSDSESIERLVRLAEIAETEAGRQLAESAAALAAKEAEVARLKRYLDEHRASGRSDQVVGGALWSNAHAFGERLQIAIEAGEREAAALAERHHEDVERWRTAHRRHAAMRELAARQAAAERREHARREQGELDDRFARGK